MPSHCGTLSIVVALIGALRVVHLFAATCGSPGSFRFPGRYTNLPAVASSLLSCCGALQSLMACA